jgi:SRSO17 transposase
MQRLLNAAIWDQDKVRDALGRYVAARLGDPTAVLTADETGFEKRGRNSAGCSGSTPGRRGRSPTARSGVFLAYAVSARGTRVLIDLSCICRSHGPETRDRCAAAGIGEDAEFATKPQLTKKMIERAIKGAPVRQVHR